jgi:NADPH:quinone reductase-like Zn-dependent oxidoreductase
MVILAEHLVLWQAERDERRRTMKAAIVNGPNQTPVYSDFRDPLAQKGHELITVTASALSRAAKGLAAGSQSTSSGFFPRVVGIDGVGTTQSGRRVYFSMPAAPFGGMAERTLVLAENCLPLPDEVEDVVAAAIANPGLSSVAALKARADLKAGETVLVNGATGAAGKLAVQLAKYLGAGKVIATGRDAATLQQLKHLGADITLNLTLERKDLEAALGEQFGGDGVDIVLDYLSGDYANQLLATIAQTSKSPKPIRYVVVGGVSGQPITLPPRVLGAVPIAIMGSSFGSVPWQRFMQAVSDVLQAVVPADLQITTLVVPLSTVEKTWNENTGKARVVFLPQES